MSLLTLPAELRLRIYDYLPELNTGNTLYIAAGNVLTPHICRTNTLLRQETLPLFARNVDFSIMLAAIPDLSRVLSNAMTVWLNGLGELGLSKLSKLHFSRDWELSRPTRNQGHVGFYLKLNRHSKDGQSFPGWQSTIGTYPIYRDMQGMRLESAELLRKTIVARLQIGEAEDAVSPENPEKLRGPRSFTREDLEFIIRAIDVIARHPFSTYDLDHDEDSRQRRRSVFEKMERELSQLVGARES